VHQKISRISIYFEKNRELIERIKKLDGAGRKRSGTCPTRLKTGYGLKLLYRSSMFHQQKE
jgi:hypothetical protein